MAKPIASSGRTTYLIDPVQGNDANPVGKTWKRIAKVNSIQLAPGDTVVIKAGLHEESLKPLGEGTADAEGWYESGPVRDQQVCSNQFINCGIEINPRTHSENPGEAVHENIRIEGDFFNDSGISARNVKGLKVIGNRFSNPTLPLQVKACTDLEIERNLFGAKQ